MSACSQPEHPKTVSDFCLIDEVISIDPAPEADANDVGNKWDTDVTVNQVLKHNASYRRVCPGNVSK